MNNKGLKSTISEIPVTGLKNYGLYVQSVAGEECCGYIIDSSQKFGILLNKNL